MSAQQWAGIIRRHDRKMLPVLGCAIQINAPCLHIQGAIVDFWATPAELYRRGYRLVMARPSVWDVWGRYGECARYPERLQAVDADIVQRLQLLVGGVDAGLNTALSSDDE